MQQIANEMALPETTFVFPPEAPETDARVRIFTPTLELPVVSTIQSCIPRKIANTSHETGRQLQYRRPLGSYPSRL
jgi:PhzF family phenazine biosynthesis protein